MFLVISHHHCKPGQVEAARERIDKNGAAMTSEPGFLYRYRIETEQKPGIVSTLTAWSAARDYMSFREKRSARGGHDRQAAPFDRIDNESYEVQSVQDSTPR
jgi:heme-degrading monooxygenase HmoA